MRIKKKHLTGFFLLTIFLVGCRQGVKSPDVSDISMSVKISRFDQEFMSIDTLHLTAGLLHLNEEYPVFFPTYMSDIMNFDYPADSSQTNDPDPYIKKFIASKDIRHLQDTINAHFDSEQIESLKMKLAQSFRYFKYYFPDFKPPRVVTFMSALSNYGAVTVDSVLGIGLDMFLGADFPLYKQTTNPYPDYILKRFTPHNMVVSSIKVLAQDRYPLPQEGSLLQQMIARGKTLYFLDKILPTTADSLKIHYTQKQLDWCHKNEQYIWQYFIRNNLLYNKNSLTVRYYIGAGPSSKGMPPEAPGNIGSWTGWQIVRHYMKKHPGVTLPELMKMDDAAQFLGQSGYHPH